MICNDILRQLRTKCMRAEARQNAIDGLTAYIKKTGPLVTYDKEFKGMVLGYLWKQHKIFDTGSKNQTTNQTYHKLRTEELVKLIDFINNEWGQ